MATKVVQAVEAKRKSSAAGSLQSRQQLAWYGSIFSSAVLYAVVGMLVQLGASDVSTMELTFARGFVQLVFSLVCMNAGKTTIPFLPKSPFDRGMVYGRAIMGAIGFICFFHSIAVLPLGDGMAVASMYPISATIAARVVLKEKVRPVAIVAMVISIVGVIMICQPHFIFHQYLDGLDTNSSLIVSSVHGSVKHYSVMSMHNSSSLVVVNNTNTGSSTGSSIAKAITSRTAGYISGFAASTLIGISYLFFRSAKDVHSLQFMGSYSVSTCILAGMLSMVLPGQQLHVPDTPAIGFVLIGQGFLAAVAQYLFIFGSKHLPSARASVIQISDIVYAYILQVLVFGVDPNMTTVVGALATFGGSVIAVMAKQDDKEKDCDHEEKSSKDRSVSNVSLLPTTAVILDDIPLPPHFLMTP